MALMSDMQAREVAAEMISRSSVVSELVGCDHHEDLVDMIKDIDVGLDTNAAEINAWIRQSILDKIDAHLPTGAESKAFKAFGLAMTTAQRYKVDL